MLLLIYSLKYLTNSKDDNNTLSQVPHKPFSLKRNPKLTACRGIQAYTDRITAFLLSNLLRISLHSLSFNSKRNIASAGNLLLGWRGEILYITWNFLSKTVQICAAFLVLTCVVQKPSCNCNAADFSSSKSWALKSSVLLVDKGFEIPKKFSITNP